MKKLIIYSIFFLGYKGHVYSQRPANREASLSRYGQTIYPFFQSLHQLHYRNQFKGQWKRYEALISFNTDSLGKMENMKLESTKPLPDSVTSYMKELLLKSNGLWKPVIKNGIEDFSDTLFIHFTIIREGCLGVRLFEVPQKERDELMEEGQLSLSGKHPNQSLYDRIKLNTEKPNHFRVILTFD
jgi:hypothetical protein